MSPFRLFGQIGLKLMSVAVAVLLWLIVAGGETVERSVRVPLELQQFPLGLELQGEAPTFVDVRMRGPSGTIGRMLPGDAAAVLNLSDAAPGRRLLQLTQDQVRVPFGVEVVQIVPATIAMVFEPSDTRIVPVVPVVEGDPAEGYVVGTVAPDPQAVEITGPATSVARVTEAMTETISVAGARARIAQTVAIGFVDPAVRLKTPGLASVVVELVPGPRERTVYDRPVKLRSLPPDLSAEVVPATVDVVLQSNRAGLGAADPDAVTALVDVSTLGVGEHALTVQVDTPGLSVAAHPNPQVVKVLITRAKR
jgi:YbbR domain-containing protein